MDVSWVFPGHIDVEKLKVALAKTLHDYPHGAGRLSYDEKRGQWSIILTNDPVPIITGTTDLIFNEELMETPHPDIVESTPYVLQPVPLVDSPLVKLKLVEWRNGEETSLTLSFHHSLGELDQLSEISIFLTVSRGWYDGPSLYDVAFRLLPGTHTRPGADIREVLATTSGTGTPFDG